MVARVAGSCIHHPSRGNTITITITITITTTVTITITTVTPL
jgi:hypothetical protein